MESSTIPAAQSNGSPAVLAELLPQHLAELRASGLNDETIRSAGIYSETNRAKLASLLNRKRWPATWGCGLVFPFTIGGKVVLHRVKPENPPKRKGNGAKYLSPTGQGCRLFIPPDSADVVLDVGQRLLVTEGEKKALAATQFGFPCVGLTGVDCWHSKNSTGVMPDLAAIPWEGRNVFVAFDSDAPDNERVRRNESLLAAAIKGQGAKKAQIIRLPAGPDGEKVGLDDFLVAHGDRELLKLIENAEDPEPVDSGELRLPAKDIDPATEAERIIKEATDGNGVLRLRFWRGTFWLWSRGRYRELADEEVRARVVRHLRPSYFGVGQGHVGNVMMHVAADCELSSVVDGPAWLGKRQASDWPCNEVLACRNGLIHLPSLVASEPDYIQPATPRFFTHSATDFDFSVNAPKPENWLRFLGELWPKDQSSIDTLAEWFGYCLVADTSQQKILLVVGPTRAGKGVIGRVQRAIVGPQNVIGPTLGSLAGGFGLWQFIGRTLGIISDARLSGRADQAAIVERLLSISGEDPQTIDRKCLPPVTCTLPTRIMLLTNELPRLRDSSGAMMERFIVLRLTKSFLGKEDIELTQKLTTELPGILLWAVMGWQRLRERGRFQQPDSSLETLATLRDIGSPVAAFVRDECVLDPTDHVEKDFLYLAFVKWSEGNGTKRVPDKEIFGRDLLAAFPEISKHRPRDNDGGRYQAYRGIRLRLD